MYRLVGQLSPVNQREKTYNVDARARLIPAADAELKTTSRAFCSVVEQPPLIYLAVGVRRDALYAVFLDLRKPRGLFAVLCERFEMREITVNLW